MKALPSLLAPGRVTSPLQLQPIFATACLTDDIHPLELELRAPQTFTAFSYFSHGWRSVPCPPAGDNPNSDPSYHHALEWRIPFARSFSISSPGLRAGSLSPKRARVTPHAACSASDERTSLHAPPRSRRQCRSKASSTPSRSRSMPERRPSPGGTAVNVTGSRQLRRAATDTVLPSSSRNLPAS